MILLAGGWSDRDISTVEIISDEKSNNQTQLPNLPTYVPGPCMLNHNNVILICGLKSCQQMNVSSGSWTYHSSLTSKRDQASGVSTDKASYIFGDMSSTKGKKHMKFCLKAPYNGKLVLPKYRMDTFGVALLPSAMMKFGSSEGLIRGEEYGQEFYPSTLVPNLFLNWVPH